MDTIIRHKQLKSTKEATIITFVILTENFNYYVVYIQYICIG